MRLLGLPAAVLAALALAAACTSATSPTVDLSGTYDLVSIQFGQGATILTPTAETGTLSLSADAYSMTLAGQVNETDEGTYAISGTAWNQTSSLQGFQSNGTYTVVGSTLDLTVVQQGVTIVSVWQRQS